VTLSFALKKVSLENLSILMDVTTIAMGFASLETALITCTRFENEYALSNLETFLNLTKKYTLT
jgi:hypothetical protein